MQTKSAKRFGANTLAYALLLVSAVLAVSPFLIALSGSLKTQSQFVTGQPLDLPSPVTFENYVRLFTTTDFTNALLVTSGVVLVTATGQIFTSILAAYAFARLRFKGRDVLFWLYLATMMIPAAVVFIPLFLMMAQLGLRNSFWGIVLPFAFVSPYAVFLLRQFFQEIPKEITDAAMLDGAGHWRILWQIIVPNAKPIIATLAVITFVSHWNNFLWPLMISPLSGSRTVTVATIALQSEHNSQWWLVMAASVVAVLPLIVLLLLFHRQLVRSVTVGRVAP
ncbi:carbohydrate ABC transporter permease [Canibacter zhoujuaniae]|uniref:carbohydrate ABC transporter permease n=1 Tax=Canibacter zhoujuaniae TaxID=2708343 RepID=UPI001424318B|nr:carbohydrate ABC transporter permease [Canibacter zhoujuaniae]